MDPQIEESSNFNLYSNTRDYEANGPTVKFLTFNTWGLKYVSKHRKQRLRAIADQIAQASRATPLPGNTLVQEEYDIIALQEVWVKEDWDYIVARCGHLFPYHRIFYSGILTGPGLVILSKIPIESTSLYRFPINGRPSACLLYTSRCV